MIVLFFDTVEPYVYESIPIMFFPEGFEYEARFKEKHVDPEILNKIRNSNSVKEFHRQKVLICIRSKQSSPPVEEGRIQPHLKNSNSQELISPLRYSEIVSIKIVAGFVLIKYKLLSYYRFTNPKNFASVQHERDIFNNQVYSNVCERKSDDELYHISSCADVVPERTIAKNPLIDSEWGEIDRVQLDAWGGVVSQFAYLPYICNIPFLIFITAREMQVNSDALQVSLNYLKKNIYNILPLKIKRFLSYILPEKKEIGVKNFKRGLVSLRPGKTYEFKIFESYPHELVKREDNGGTLLDRVPHEDHSRVYELALDDNYFSKKWYQNAIGGYDFIEFSIATRPNTHGSRGALAFTIPKLKDSPTRKFISDQLFVHYEIEVGWRLTWYILGWFLVVFLAAATGLNWPTQLKAELALYITPALSGIFVEIIQTSVLALGIAGIVSYWATRRQ